MFRETLILNPIMLTLNPIVLIMLHLPFSQKRIVQCPYKLYEHRIINQLLLSTYSIHSATKNPVYKLGGGVIF